MTEGGQQPGHFPGKLWLWKGETQAGFDKTQQGNAPKKCQGQL